MFLLWIWIGGAMGAITVDVLEKDEWPDIWYEWVFPLVWPVAILHYTYGWAKRKYRP